MKTELIRCNRLYKLNKPDEEEDFKIINLAKYLSRRVMKGRTASLGTAIGRATIIRKIEDIEKVKEGAIVISRNALPELASVANKAGAIATEYGGHTAYAMEYARVYGIPAVAEVSGITETIKDGDVIEVDGTKGTVELIKHRALHRQKTVRKSTRQ